MTYDEIGARLGLTRQRAEQITKAALEKLDRKPGRLRELYELAVLWEKFRENQERFIAIGLVDTGRNARQRLDSVRGASGAGNPINRCIRPRLRKENFSYGYEKNLSTSGLYRSGEQGSRDVYSPLAKSAA